MSRSVDGSDVQIVASKYSSYIMSAPPCKSPLSSMRQFATRNEAVARLVASCILF